MVVAETVTTNMLLVTDTETTAATAVETDVEAMTAEVVSYHLLSHFIKHISIPTNNS